MVVFEGDSQVLGLAGCQGLGVLLVCSHHAGQIAPVHEHLPPVLVSRDGCARLHAHAPGCQLCLQGVRLQHLGFSITWFSVTGFSITALHVGSSGEPAALSASIGIGVGTANAIPSPGQASSPPV